MAHEALNDVAIMPTCVDLIVLKHSRAITVGPQLPNWGEIAGARSATKRDVG